MTYESDQKTIAGLRDSLKIAKGSINALKASNIVMRDKIRELRAQATAIKPPVYTLPSLHDRRRATLKENGNSHADQEKKET